MLYEQLMVSDCLPLALSGISIANVSGYDSTPMKNHFMAISERVTQQRAILYLQVATNFTALKACKWKYLETQRHETIKISGNLIK